MLQQKLQASQKALSTFLEEKRNTFSRFFFLGDEDLLEILGRPDSVQTHLRKLFAGVASLTITEGQVTAVQSIENEEIRLREPVDIQNAPEIWLGELSEALKKLLRSMSGQIKGTSEIEKYPAQIICLVQQLDFC